MKALDLRPLPSLCLLRDLRQRVDVSKVYDFLDKGLYEKARSAAADLEQDISLLVLSDVHRCEGDHWGAVDLAEEAVEAFRTKKAQEEEAAAWVALCRAKLQRGSVDSDQAVAKARQMLQDVPADQALAKGFSHVIAAEAAMAMKEYSKAMWAAKVAVHCFRDRDAMAQASALLLLSSAAKKSSCFREAVFAAEMAAVTARTSREVIFEALATRLGSEALLRLGEAQQAAKLAEESVALFKAAGNYVQQVEVLVLAAEAHLHRVKQREGNAQRSSLIAWASRALDLANQALTLKQSRDQEARAWLLKAQAAKAAGNLQKALEDAREAELMMTDCSNRQGVASALLLQAQVKTLMGNDSEAASLTTQAQALSKTSFEGWQDMPVKSPATVTTLQGFGDIQKSWDEHIHFSFSGLQGRPVSNVVRGK